MGIYEKEKRPIDSNPLTAGKQTILFPIYLWLSGCLGLWNNTYSPTLLPLPHELAHRSIQVRSKKLQRSCTHLFRVFIRVDTGLSACSKVAEHFNRITITAVVRIDPVPT